MLKRQGQEERDPRINHSLFSIQNFLIYFVMVCFVVTCSFFVFFSAIDLPTTDIAKSAKLTFLNIFILSLLVSMIESLRRKYTVERPVKRILQETKKITEAMYRL